MRILLVANGFPPFSMYGTEVYTYNLARALQTDGHTVHVFFPVDRGGPAHTTFDGIHGGIAFTAIDQPSLPFRDFRYHYNDRAVVPVFVRLLQRFQPEVVHFTYVLHKLSASLVTWTKRAGIPTVITLTDVHFMCQQGQLLDTNNEQCHGPEGGVRCTRVCAAIGHFPLDEVNLLPETAVVQDVWSPSYDSINPLVLRDRYLRTVLASADAIIAPTEWVGSKVIEWGIPSALVRQAEFGIDTHLLRGYVRRPADHLRVGFIGQIVRHKGVHTLLAAFSACESARAELKIYGDTHSPAAENLLREAARFTEDPRIRFCGTFPPEEIGAVLGEIDVLVIPSIWHENSPLVLRNAIATATPVIVSAMEGMRPYVREMENGLLFEAGNVEDLRQTLQKVLDHPELLDHFRTNPLPTTTIEEDAARLSVLYVSLQGTGRSLDNSTAIDTAPTPDHENRAAPSKSSEAQRITT